MKRTALIVSLVAAVLSARADYGTLPVETDEAMGEFIRYESRDWAVDASGEGGRLATNATWTGEHVILNNVYVPSGVTLTLGPGTRVLFRTGTCIKVEDGGTVVLNGEDGKEIVLSGYAAETHFGGLVIQSAAATYKDNGYAVADGFAFDQFATVSLGDTTTFVAGGEAIIPVSVSGTRANAFSFDWVAETNGVAFASGTMNWNKVEDGRKNLIVPFDGAAFATLSNFTVRASFLRCCRASKQQGVVTLSEFISYDIETDEAMGGFIRFESRDWTTNFTDVANAEGGRLAADAVWSNEHVIVSDVYVPSGVTLTLTADAVVRFCEGTMIKVEDGGTLNIVGADGHDVVLCGYTGGTKYTGVVKMPSGTLTDNGYVRVDGDTLSTLAKVSLNNADTFRSLGLAQIPVTVSGSRSTAFSVEWVAETNGVPYKTGTVHWNGVSDGSKVISISHGPELDGLDSFIVRVAVHRACHANPDRCVVTLRDFTVADVETDEEMGSFIRFESRDRMTNMIDVANADGGRLTTNATWTGEHVVMNDVYISRGVTLTIAADALIRLCEGVMIKIEDGGVLNVVGAEGHDVIVCNYDAAVASRGIVKMSSGTYTDNMYVQYPDFKYGDYPTLTLNDARTRRDAGKVYVPIAVSGTARSQSFNADWETDGGATGTVTWAQSSEGTKWIELPVSPESVGGEESYAVRLTAARGANLAVANAKVTICEYDHPVTNAVAVSDGSNPSDEFAYRGDVMDQQIYLTETEELRYSGRWQGKAAPETVVSRISVESDNGVTRLGEWPGTEEGKVELRFADYNVGYYTLKHEIVDAATEKVIDTKTKSFSVVDRETVELHGGTLTQSETWKAGKTHVVYETVVVPSVYTLFIEPGAVVKFMSGTGIDISTGGALFANAVVFTHIADDTVGGDTLSDGYTVAPPMNAYALTGNFTFGANTEIHYMAQAGSLTGTISDQRVLFRGSTYRVKGTLTVASGASLTISSGTVLKMDAGASIVVNAGGTLHAQGTRAAPVVFTSIKDDVWGGDTNGDGDKTLPDAGDWHQINNSGVIDMDYCQVLWCSAQNNQGALFSTGGTWLFRNSIVAHCEYDNMRSTKGEFVAENSLFLDGSMGAAPAGGSAKFVNCVFNYLTTAVRWGCGEFYNCVFSDIATDILDTSFSTLDCKFDHCIFWNPEGTGNHAAEKVGRLGCVYADPLFIDVENWDFRTDVDSPCVDAANSEVAPATDYYGQPRITVTDTGTNVVQGQLADIGICEVMPRSVASDIDLVAKSVRCDTNAVPGQLIFVKWEVENVGGAEVTTPWYDSISLVSADGAQEVTLGDKMTSSAIAVGGTVFCSAYFTVPVMAEGTWRPKVNVNSYHDVFEGMLTTNNVLVGSGTVAVTAKPIEAGEDFEGNIMGGLPKVLKLAFGDSNSNRMVRLTLPAGVSVRWGFGFMPSANMSSGEVTSVGGDVLFYVPEDAIAVYVSLESDDNAAFAMSFEDNKVEITGVSPNTLPSSGTVTITIDGAGFTSDSAVYLVNGGTRIAPESVQYISSQQLVSTVDCANLKAGTQYDVFVVGTENTATAPASVSAAKVKGEGKLEAHLILPDAARHGRVVTGYVEYSNTGTADMNAPIFIVKGSMSGTRVGLATDTAAMTNQIKLIGISDSYPAGRLKVGETVRLPFNCRVVGAYGLKLSCLDENSLLQRESAFKTWKSFCTAMVDAATSLSLAGISTDYDSVYGHAMRAAYGMNVGIISGTIRNRRTGTPIEGARMVIIETNGNVGVSTAVSDKHGKWAVTGLQRRLGYEIRPQNCNGDSVLVELSDSDCVNCEMTATPYAAFACRVDGLPNEGVRLVATDAFSSNEEEAIISDGTAYFESLKDGEYVVNGLCSGGYIATNVLTVLVTNGFASCRSPAIGFAPCGEIVVKLIRAGGSNPATNVVVEASDNQGNVYTAISDSSGSVRIKVLPGTYSISVNGEYVLAVEPDAIPVAVGATRTLELQVAEIPFVVLPSAGPAGLTSEFSLVDTNRWPADAIYEWDFDGDGVVDSNECNPRWTYEVENVYDVTLTVTANGNKLVYRKPRAVDVWGETVQETWPSTLIIESTTGISVTESGDDFIVFETGGNSDVIYPNQIVVVPGDELRPRKILEVIRRDDKSLYCKTEFVVLTKAYRTLRTCVKTLCVSSAGKSAYGIQGKDTALHGGISGTLCGVSEYENNTFEITPTLKFPTLDGPNISVTPKITMPITVSIDVADGKTKRFYAVIGVHGEVDLTVFAKARKETESGGYEDDEHKKILCFLQSPEGLPLLFGLPQHLSVSLIWRASVQGEGNIQYSFGKDTELKWDYKNPKKLSRENVDKDTTDTLKLTGKLDAKVKVGLGLTYGVGTATSDLEKYADIANVTFSGGWELGITETVTNDEQEPDTYAAYSGPFVEGECNILAAGWNDWEASVFHGEFDFRTYFKKKNFRFEWGWETPLPAFSTSANRIAEDSYRIEFQSKTVVPTDSAFRSREWRFKGENLGDEEKVSTKIVIAPDDEVAYDVELREGYAPKGLPDKLAALKFLWHQKMAKSTVYVCGVNKIRADGDEPVEPEIEYEEFTGTTPQSCDPNEMRGPQGRGDLATQRYVKPGEWMTYTVYFENKSTATAAAQEVKVTNPLNKYLDWSTFEMGEMAFNNQIDLGLSGKQNGTSEVKMNGTNYYVRSSVTLDRTNGSVSWYQRIVDKTTETTWPTDAFAGFLPPNDSTYRGEGHISYRIKVRDDAPAGVRIDNAATIVFDYNEPIATDPAWWNTVAPEKIEAKFGSDEVVVNEGSNIVVSVFGGSAYAAASVQVCLAYQTASSSDIDLAKATLDGETVKGGVKFPLTLTWARGEIGERKISIPVKADKAVEADETLVFQLATALGQRLGATAACAVTIRDANVAADYAAKQAKETVKAKKGVATNALAVACCAGDGSGDVCGYTTGQGRYYKGCKATLKATARPGWEFRGWGEVVRGGAVGDGTPTLPDGVVTNILSEKASWSVTLTNDAEIVALFGRIPYVAGLASPADGGKVAGSGYCATGKKITLKATANKNYTFTGWYTNDVLVSSLASLVLDRSARPGKSNAKQTVITNVSESVTYYATFKSDPTVYVYLTADDGATAPGKVTGTGKYAAGKKKIALKATANKGYVFRGWYEGASVDLINDVPLTKSATYTLAEMPTNDVEYTAGFITANLDKSYIAATVDCFGFDATHLSHATNIWAGVYLEWPVAASALSETTIKVAGLPSGLKFTAKDVTQKIGSGKTAQTVVVVPANTIYGAPSAASKTAKDKKTGAVTVAPSQVKVTVTTAGKSSQTYQIDTTVNPLPSWAVGTFAGPSYSDAIETIASTSAGEGAYTNGAVSVTIGANGKISAKQPVNGKSTSFAASYFDSYAAGESAFYATLTAKVGKEVVTNKMGVVGEEMTVGGGTPTLPNTVVTNGVIEADRFDAWQYNWKVEPWKTLIKPLDKTTFTYVILSNGTIVDENDGGEGLAALPGNVTGADGVRALPVDGADVVGKVTLKFSASGSVAVSGEFVSGYDTKKAKYTTVKATGSTIVVPGEDGQGLALVYLTPKGVSAHVRCVEIPWSED